MAATGIVLIGCGQSVPASLGSHASSASSLSQVVIQVRLEAGTIATVIDRSSNLVSARADGITIAEIPPGGRPLLRNGAGMTDVLVGWASRPCDLRPTILISGTNELTAIDVFSGPPPGGPVICPDLGTARAVGLTFRTRPLDLRGAMHQGAP